MLDSTVHNRQNGKDWPSAKLNLSKISRYTVSSPLYLKSVYFFDRSSTHWLLPFWSLLLHTTLLSLQLLWLSGCGFLRGHTPRGWWLARCGCLPSSITRRFLLVLLWTDRHTYTHTNHIPGLQSAAIAHGMEDLRLLIFVTLNPHYSL